MTRRVETLYEGSQEAPFFSNVKGKQQLLANGDLLITEAEQGRVFEVTPDGRIVWSHISRFDADHVSKISDAERYSENYAAVPARLLRGREQALGSAAALASAHRPRLTECRARSAITRCASCAGWTTGGTSPGPG